MIDHTNKSIAEQAKAIEANLLSPLTLLEAYLDKIRNQPQSKNIFTEIYYDEALKEAENSEERQKRGLRKSLLDGIPINWKDLFDFEGKKSEGGSLLLSGRIAKSTAEIVINANKFGLVSIGKTHLTEFAFSGLGVNPKTATPPNSTNNLIAPGGSSSGSAVATALSLSSAGIGSDTGGSVRIPAAWNNLVGFKPTHGNLSLNGVLKLCPSFDTAGPITKTVQDSDYLYHILKGEQPRDLPECSLNDKKFLVDRSFLTRDLSPEIGKNFETCLEKIRTSGAKIIEANIPEIIESTLLAATIFPYEAYNTWGEIIEKQPEKMHPPILSRFRGGMNIDQKVYLSSWEKLNLLRKSFLRRIDGFASLLAPTCPILPPKVKDLMDSEDHFTKCNLLSLRNTRVANLLGLTSITIPTEINCCGLMLLGKPGCDQDILQSAKLFENMN